MHSGVTLEHLHQKNSHCAAQRGAQWLFLSLSVLSESFLRAEQTKQFRKNEVVAFVSEFPPSNPMKETREQQRLEECLVCAAVYSVQCTGVPDALKTLLHAQPLLEQMLCCISIHRSNRSCKRNTFRTRAYTVLRVTTALNTAIFHQCI